MDDYGYGYDLLGAAYPDTAKCLDCGTVIYVEYLDDYEVLCSTCREDL